MKRTSHIVRSGGWIKREYRTQPVAVLVGSLAFIAAVVAGILAIAVIVLWRIDGAVHIPALRWTLGGTSVAALLILLTALVAKREHEKTIFRYDAPNPEYDPGKLY